MAEDRLREERSQWRKDHPVGFSARPEKKAGTLNLLRWVCAIPGKKGTCWEGGRYSLVLIFPANYPFSPPQCKFTPPIFHPNVYDSGAVCLSIIGHAYKPSISVKQILVGVQELLDTPNLGSPANNEAKKLYADDRAAYNKRITELAKQCAPS